MGGSGSGTWQRMGTKDRTSSRLRIPINGLKGPNGLIEGATGLIVRGGQSLSFRLEGDGLVLGVFPRLDTIQLAAKPYWIAFQHTPCHLGGQRRWFTCPSCQRRVGVVYLEGGNLACRRCCGLAYSSQLEGQTGRLITKAQKLRKRLGASGCFFAPLPDKPKGMHCQTYWRYLQRLVEAEKAATKAIIAELGG